MLNLKKFWKEVVVAQSRHYADICLNRLRKFTGNISESSRCPDWDSKAQLDGAWLGSFYVLTDVSDKESYSNAPCIRPGAARLVIGWARLVGSPQKWFFHDPQRDSARAAVAATRGLQSARQASLVQVYIHRSGLCFLLSGCASRTYTSKAAGPPFAELRRVM
jgi:hypothetical protein